GHWRAMIVDQDGQAVGLVHGVSGEVDLAHGPGGQRVQVRLGVEPDVPRAHVDVVDIAQEPASRAANELAEELRLGNARVTEPEITRRVFHAEAGAEPPL